MNTSIPSKRQLNPQSPHQEAIDTVIRRLRSDRAYAIAVAVGNNYPAIASRYEAITGRTAPQPATAMANRLTQMQAAGQRMEVINITNVPWVYSGEPSNVLDAAWRQLSQEAQYKVNNPTVPYGTPKAGPYAGDDNDPELDPGNQASNDATDAPSGSGTGSWLQNINQFMGSITGVITALNGGIGGAPSSGAPTPQPATDWGKVALIVGGITAAIVGLVLIIKLFKK